jgi:uncharacterized protein
MSAHVIALVVGVVMGILIQRMRASNPSVILKNLRLEDFSVLKFMATAIAVGAVLVHVIASMTAVHFAVKPTYVVGLLLGGVVFGAGFAVGGYCPGTCIVGAAEGRRDALATIAGGITGALVFTLVYTSVIKPLIAMMNFGKITVADVTHLPRWAAVAIVAALIGAAARALPERSSEEDRA